MTLTLSYCYKAKTASKSMKRSCQYFVHGQTDKQSYSHSHIHIYTNACTYTQTHKHTHIHTHTNKSQTPRTKQAFEVDKTKLGPQIESSCLQFHDFELTWPFQRQCCWNSKSEFFVLTLSSLLSLARSSRVDSLENDLIDQSCVPWD